MFARDSGERIDYELRSKTPSLTKSARNSCRAPFKLGIGYSLMPRTKRFEMHVAAPAFHHYISPVRSAFP